MPFLWALSNPGQILLLSHCKYTFLKQRKSHCPWLKTCQSSTNFDSSGESGLQTTTVINSLGWSCAGLYFPSTSSTQNMIGALFDMSLSQIVWYPFPNGYGLLGTHIPPGQYLINQSIMLLPIHEIQPRAWFWIESINHFADIMKMLIVL